MSKTIDWATFPSGGTFTADGNITSGSVGTLYYKRILPNVVFIWGRVTPTSTTNNYTLPFTSPLATPQTFICYGSGSNSTKAFIPENSSTLGFMQGTVSGGYAVNILAILS